MKTFDCVIVCAHPDDAFLGMGGTVKKLISNGKSVLIVCATNGENGNTDLGEIRKSELENSCKILGCDFTLLKMKDGELTFHIHELFLSISELLLQNNPQYIFTHHGRDSHSDHRTVYDVVKHAVEKLWHAQKQDTKLKALFSFVPIHLSMENIPDLQMNHWVAIDSSKIEPLMLHQSQMPYLEKNLKKHIALNKYLGALIGTDMAEAFWAEKYNDVKMLVLNED